MWVESIFQKYLVINFMGNVHKHYGIILCIVIVQLLLRYDANPDLRDEDGQTALQKAQERDGQWHQQVAEILRDPCENIVCWIIHLCVYHTHIHMVVCGHCGSI